MVGPLEKSIEGNGDGVGIRKSKKYIDVCGVSEHISKGIDTEYMGRDGLYMT